LRISKEQLIILRKRYQESKVIREVARLERKQVPAVSNLSELKQQFQGEDIHVLGSGLSLYGIDWDLFNGKKTICINNTIKYCNKPTVHVFLDMPVLEEGGKKHGVPIITRIGNSVQSNVNDIYKIRCGRAMTQNPIERGFYSAFSTGHIAIHLALYFGAKNIYLWGIEKGFMNREEIVKLSDYMKESGYYKKLDIVDQYDRLKKSNKGFGHFYSTEWQHRRDNKPNPYQAAGDKLKPFYQFDNIFQASPVHFTQFNFKKPIL